MRTSLSFLPLAAALALAAGCGSGGGGGPEKEKIAPPEILSFSADPTTIELGAEVKLTWSVRGADSVELKNTQGETNDLGAEENGSIVVTPTDSTTYTLWAYNAGGNSTRRAEIRVIDTGRPRIQLSADPSKITIGEGSTLRWSVTGATHLTLREGSTVLDDAAPVTGSLEVQPDHTTTYHADAEGPGGSDTKTVKIEVMAAIDSFTAAETEPVLKGAPVELSWSVRGADKLVLSNLDGYETEIDAGMLESGTATAPAGSAGAFRLTAFRSGAQSTATARVDILGAPKITMLEPSAPFVTAASEANPIAVTISWRVDGADALSLAADPGGPIFEDRSDLTGSVPFEVTAGTTRFVMTATNAAGSTTRETRVTSVPVPAVVTFAASRLLVGANDPLQLSWKATGATRVDLLANGVVAAGGIAVEGGIGRIIAEETNFTLRATNAAGAVAERDLLVEVGPPAIDAFGADPSEGPAGTQIRLGWSTRGAIQVGIVDDFGMLVEGCLADPTQVDDGECVAILPPGDGEIEWTLKTVNGSGETTQPITLERWEVAP